MRYSIFLIVFLISFLFVEAQEKAKYMQIPVDQISILRVDAKDSVTIRSGPGRTFKSICRLPNGWPVTFIKETDKFETIAQANGTWINISFQTPEGQIQTGYIFDYFIYLETKYLKMVFQSVECSEGCYNHFEYKGENIVLGNYLCADRGPISYFQDEEGNAIEESVQKTFLIKLVSEKYEDLMAVEMTNGEVKYVKDLYICELKQVD